MHGCTSSGNQSGVGGGRRRAGARGQGGGDGGCATARHGARLSRRRWRRPRRREEEGWPAEQDGRQWQPRRRCASRWPWTAKVTRRCEGSFRRHAHPALVPSPGGERRRPQRAGGGGRPRRADVSGREAVHPFRGGGRNRRHGRRCRNPPPGHCRRAGRRPRHGRRRHRICRRHVKRIGGRPLVVGGRTWCRGGGGRGGGGSRARGGTNERRAPPATLDPWRHPRGDRGGRHGQLPYGKFRAG